MDVEENKPGDYSYIIYMIFFAMVVVVVVWLIIIMIYQAPSVLFAIGQPELHAPLVIDTMS